MPVDGTIQLAYQDTAWFNDPLNSEIILKEGQHVYLSDGADEFLSAYVVGDGVTELQDLPWKGLIIGVQSVTGSNVDNTDPANPVVNNPTLQQVTDNGANTTNQMQINGVNVATVNDIPSLSGYVDTAGLTTNKVLKATSSTTAGDSNITDDGTIVIIESPNALNSIYVSDVISGYGYGSNESGGVDTNDSRTSVTHTIKNIFNAPANNFPYLTASQSVETDASKNLVSVAHYTESFAYTGSPFTLTVAPNYIFSIRTTSMVLDESDINDVTIVGTTLTVINPAFQAGETLYIKYKG